MNYQEIHIVERAGAGERISDDEALVLVEIGARPALYEAARASRDRTHASIVTYSPKVFIPLTRLCRDVCRYCTFATTPKLVKSPYLSIEEMVSIARTGAAAGCHEALFTLGDKPELRYRAARAALADLGFETTHQYLAEAAKQVQAESGLLPHVNPGVMTASEYALIRPVSVSSGMMLESISERLCERGGPHFGSPDKHPAVRLESIKAAGRLAIPFTTGILIGIGENRLERVQSLLAIRALHEQYGHIQEVIIQNFCAKPDTPMAEHDQPDVQDLAWTIAVSRLILGSEMSIQAPPNLSPGVLGTLLDAGINDWGGVSPVTPDHVNPEAPWPHLKNLRAVTREAGKALTARLPIYPRYALDSERWLDSAQHTRVLQRSDALGFAREDRWVSGGTESVPSGARGESVRSVIPNRGLPSLLSKAADGDELEEAEIVQLFEARGDEVTALCEAADDLRRKMCGDEVTYVVNRNINYTNVCYFKCQFCAFSKGKLSESLRGKPYVLDLEEIARRTEEAWARGATEVCLQGGIHRNTPDRRISIFAAR